MSLSTIAVLNAFLAAAVVLGLAAVMSWPLLVSRAPARAEQARRRDEELRRAA
jgi:hypothetical protein